MKVILTDHTKQRMVERGIKINKIYDAIELPDYTITKNGKIEAHKKFDDKTLKVIYIKNKFIKVVTVIWK